MMQNGVFLMEDRRALQVDGIFQGILGIGLPDAKFSEEFPVFPVLAGVQRYTLCFNDGPLPGALVMNAPQLPNPMTNIGTVHWGLDMQGFSVGDQSAPVLFCDPANKGANMDTTCGAIPDSGTTFMLGPRDQILSLYRSICESWPRCKAERMNSSRDSAEIFNDLLYRCGEWMTQEQGVYEIPPIFLHLAGADGKPQKFELSPWAYIIETTAREFVVVTEKIFDGVYMRWQIPTDKLMKTCQAAFSPQNYETSANGPVWIIGTPLFYEYTIGYNIATNPKQIAVIDTPCATCQERGTTSLLSSHVGSKPAASRKRGSRTHVMPRVHKGPHREPTYHIGESL
jgi:hypothetical protein